MKMAQDNNGLKSKIILLQIPALIVGIISIWGLLPPEIIDKMEQTVLILLPFLTIIARRYFNKRNYVPADIVKDLVENPSDNLKQGKSRDSY